MTWNGTDHEPQPIYAEENPFPNGPTFEAFPCGHESIQGGPVRYFLAEPVSPIGAQFSRYRGPFPIGESYTDHDGTRKDGSRLDGELCGECLERQIQAGRAVLVEADG